MNTAITRLAVLFVSCNLVAPALAQSGEGTTVPANAQEQAPAALLGAWKADIGASRYAYTAPRNNIRTFSYTGGGKVLVTSTTLNSRGRISMLHWAVQLDGTPAPEYTQGSRSTPASLVALEMEDERTFNMTVSKYGKVTLTGQMKLSDDGETLTYNYGAPGGEQNHIVYRRWDMAE